MDNAFLFDESSTGICSEDDYPYAMHRRWLRGCGSEKGECTPVEHTRTQTFTDVENTADALVEAIAQQPVSIAMYVFLQNPTFAICESDTLKPGRDSPHHFLLFIDTFSRFLLGL